LVLFNLDDSLSNQNKILNVFENSSRVESVKYIQDQEVEQLLEGYHPLKDHFFEKPKVKTKLACLIKFSSNSAARKTLDTMLESYRLKLQFFWLNEEGLLVRKAEPYRKDYKDEKFRDDDFDENSSPVGVMENLGDLSFSSASTELENSPCAWTSFVIPILDEGFSNNSPQKLTYRVEKGSNRAQWFWNQVELKENEVKNKISCDPNFVGNLLGRVMMEEVNVA